MRNGAIVLVTSVVLGIIAAPAVVEGQTAGRVYRVGTLSIATPAADLRGPEPRSRALAALLQRLRELGYAPGQNLLIEPRSAEGRADQLPLLAAELVRIPVDVIVASGPPAVRAVQQATHTIPIVALGGPDPVGSGLVGSIARPAGNVTGLSSGGGPEIVGKRLELLKEAFPRITRVAYLATRENWESPTGIHTQTAAKALGVTLLHAEVNRPEQLSDAFAAVIRERADALLVQPSSVNFVHRQLVLDFATKQRLPAMYGFRDFAEAGGLMAYGQSSVEMHRHAADFVDKILKGAKPADLPVEQPTKFELVINAKTARAIGLTIRPSVLLRADQVIE